MKMKQKSKWIVLSLALAVLLFVFSFSAFSAEDSSITLNGTSVSLSSEIALNYYFTASSDMIEACTVQFTYAGREKSVALKDGEVTDDGIKISVGLNVCEVALDVTMTIVDEEGVTVDFSSANHNEKQSGHTYSVKQYVSDLVASNGVSDEAKNAAKSVLLYAYYAQAYLTGTAPTAFDDILSQTDKTYISDSEFGTVILGVDEANEYIVKRYSFENVISGSPSLLGSGRLILDSYAKIRIALKVSEAPAVSSENAKFSVFESDGIYYVDICDIAVGNFDTVYTLNINGTTAKINLLSAAGVVANHEELYGEDFANFAKAIYAYYHHVKYYANSENHKLYDYDSIVIELAKAFDRQGAQIPYDQLIGRRSLFATPEDATAQKTLFLDCSSYLNSIYRVAFGVNLLPYEVDEVSCSTLHYDTYAKENGENIDVLGYWENTEWSTAEDRTRIAEWINANLRIGDVIVYRHGVSAGTKGHCYIYIGNGKFMHCAGAGSYTANSKNPSQSYDNKYSEITSNGTIAEIKYSTIFTTETSSRYIFKATESDTVYSLGMLRPLARGVIPTEQTLARMKIAGLDMEKTASVWENNALLPGSLLTYTVTLKNYNNYALTNIEITDLLPKGVAFVSGDDGVSCEDGIVSWTGDVGADSTVNVSFTVRVSAENAGDLIVSDGTYVSGVVLGTITHTVCEMSDEQLAILREFAIRYASENQVFSDTVAMIKAVYSSLGIDLFTYTDAQSILDQIIDLEHYGKADTELSSMVAPNLYGGMSIKYGWTWYAEQKDRIRLPMEQNLAIGDIIVADWQKGSDVYLYVGNHTLLTVADGKCTALTIGEDIFTPGVNILISLLGYDRFAVLRPSMCFDAPSLDISDITLVSNPTKTDYLDGETFDPSGMIIRATLTDGTVIDLTDYTLSHGTLTCDTTFVRASLGVLYVDIPVKVSKTSTALSVDEVSKLMAGKDVTVKGIVVGVAHEGLNNDSELLIKDTESDTVIAVRDIPYGTFPDFGYSIGDVIVFSATVKKDTSTSTNYELKKYLSFSSENGEIESTIISSGNKVSYQLDNVVTIESTADLTSFFVKNQMTPYTYIKITGETFLHYYEGKDTVSYRLHKNPNAIDSEGAFETDLLVALRDDVMTANLGASWTELFYEELVSGYPGISVDKEFYALYIGGNKSYYQLVVLDSSWISDPMDSIYTAISEAHEMDIGASSTFEGIVMGVAHEGLNNDAELLIKDLKSDACIALRGIPYGEFPDFGYKVGDRIIFKATVKKDSSGSTHYKLKKYLAFTTKSEDIASTIVSRGNKLSYKLDNVVQINNWEDFKAFFANEDIAQYTYLKISGGFYLKYHPGTDTDNYRVHLNPVALENADAYVTGTRFVTLRADTHEANLGEDWEQMLFEEVSEEYPGVYVEKDIYVLYVGGNKTYYQLVILDPSWIKERETDA